jgi:hypothetical protein
LFIKTLDSELDPDPQLGKTQDPDPLTDLLRKTANLQYVLSLTAKPKL